MSNCVSSGVCGIPFLTVAQHGCDDAEHAPGDSNDDDLWRLAVGDETLAEGHEGRVAARGCEGRHIGDVADLRPAAPDEALAGFLATVVVERCHTDKGGQLLPVDLLMGFMAPFLKGETPKSFFAQ